MEKNVTIVFVTAYYKAVVLIYEYNYIFSKLNRFDLRFIPDGTTFDDDPTDVCKDTPNPDTYKPKTFFNTALMQGNQMMLEKW